MDKLGYTVALQNLWLGYVWVSSIFSYDVYPMKNWQLFLVQFCFSTNEAFDLSLNLWIAPRLRLIFFISGWNGWMVEMESLTCCIYDFRLESKIENYNDVGKKATMIFQNLPKLTLYYNVSWKF